MIQFNTQFEIFYNRKEKINKYKGFKVIRDYLETKSFKIFGSERIIIINPEFMSNVSKNQCFFILEWSIAQYKYRDVKKAYAVVVEYCNLLGIETKEIDSLIEVVSKFNNLEINSFHITHYQKIFLKIKLYIKKIIENGTFRIL
jgi:hypothetical protein